MAHRYSYNAVKDDSRELESSRAFQHVPQARSKTASAYAYDQSAEMLSSDRDVDIARVIYAQDIASWPGSTYNWSPTVQTTFRQLVTLSELLFGA